MSGALVSEEAAALATDAVDRAAGRAYTATGLTGCFIRVQGAGDIDPIAAWHTITKPKP
jgi:hypothetical protein